MKYNVLAQKITSWLIFLLSFFLINIKTSAQDSEEFFTEKETKEVYDKVFRLEFDRQNRENVQKNKTPLYLVVEDFSDMILVLLSESKSNYEKAKSKEEERLEALEKFKDSDNLYYKEHLWAKAEIKLHHAMLRLSFDEKWSAAWRVHQAYKLLLESEEKFPDLIHAKKSLALLQITLASVPKKYQWALDLIGMEANFEEGIKNLKKSTSKTHFFQKESLLWQSLLQSYLLENQVLNGKKPEEVISKIFEKYPSEKLSLLLGSLILLKNQQPQKALAAWQDYARAYQNGKLTFQKLELQSLDYLLAELYFYDAKSYKKAKFHYLSFLKKTKTNSKRNFVKSAYHKLFLIEWFENERIDFKENRYFQSVSEKGRSRTNNDRQAQKFWNQVVEQQYLPNRMIYQTRTLTDGGNYQKALQVLNQIKESELQSVETILEYQYRKARLFHKLRQTKKAVSSYEKVIDYSTNQDKNEVYYFAANSALQLGYLFQKTNKPLAKTYFQKAIAFTGHPYEESIAQKAKLALQNLPNL